jgi:uncharacterized membrane protein YhfC
VPNVLAWLAFLVAFALTVALPTAAAAWLRLRRGVPFRVFEVAAAFYLLNLVVQVPVFRGLAAIGPQLGAVLAPAIYALCEETLRYLSFRAGRTMRSARHADGALAAGLGHGGMEAAIFALILGWTVAMATFAPDVLRAQGVAPLQSPAGLAGSMALFTAGRLAAIACHVGFATLVVLAYRRSVAFLPLAVVAHFAVDVTTFGLQARGGPWWVLAFGAWAAGAAALVALTRRSGWLRQEAGVPAEELAAAGAPR